MKSSLVRTLCVLLAMGTTPAVAQQTVVAGRSLGRVFLGMPRADVWKILHRPGRQRTARGIPAPHPRGAYTLDTWSGAGGRFLSVLCRDGRVVQIEANGPQFATAQGDSRAAPFAAVRRRHPRMRVDAYGFSETDRGQPAGGFVNFYVDDVRRGIAFTSGTQDDESTYDDLPKLKPDTLIVHAPGARALPVSEDPETQVAVEPHDPQNDYLPEIRDWFAGGPHKKTH